MAANTASSAPAARKSARSRSLGRKATQLRRTSVAISAVAIARLPSNRTSSTFRNGWVPPPWAWATAAQKCPASTSSTPARSALSIRCLTSGPGAAGALECVFHLLDVRRQTPRRRRDARTPGRRGRRGEGVGQPRRVHSGETGCQVGAGHLVVGKQGRAQLVRIDGPPHGSGGHDLRSGSWGGPELGGRQGGRGRTESQAHPERDRPDYRSAGHEPPAPGSAGSLRVTRARPGAVVRVLVHEQWDDPARTRRAPRGGDSRRARRLGAGAPHRGNGRPVGAPGNARAFRTVPKTIGLEQLV